MKTTRQTLTAEQKKVAARIAAHIESSIVICAASEGDIRDYTVTAKVAIDLPDASFRAFEIEVYRWLVKLNHAFDACLTAEFRRELRA